MSVMAWRPRVTVRFPISNNACSAAAAHAVLLMDGYRLRMWTFRVGEGCGERGGEYGAVCNEACNTRTLGCSVGWCCVAACALPHLARGLYSLRVRLASDRGSGGEVRCGAAPLRCIAFPLRAANCSLGAPPQTRIAGAWMRQGNAAKQDDGPANDVRRPRFRLR